MAQRFSRQRDGVDADRIGRMGGRRNRERSVNSELAKRLHGFKGRVQKSRSADSSSRGMRQRVVVKAHVSRHKAGKSAGSLGRHVSYLGRESASADGKHGVFYDAERSGVDARQEALQWAQDRHHFRLIISPERGGDIPDMTAYVRELMRRVERDLTSNGTVESGKLTWIAVNHHNTDNPHAHVLLRGGQANGADLVIPRQYISYGIRDRASDVATEVLGERSAQEVQQARAKEVEAERFTSLDRMIERHLENGKIDVSPSKHIGYGAKDRRLVVGRLQFLEQMELAHKGRGTVWQVEGDFKQSLRELGDRNDIIKQLYSQMGSEAGRVVRLNASVELAEPVAGVVIAKGSTDEIGEDRFVVIRDRNGQANYGRVRDNDAYRDLQVGSIAELGAGQQRRHKVATQIAAVAKVNGGLYSPQLHEAYLRASQPDSTDREIDSNVRSAVWRLNFVAGFEQAGVSAAENGVFTVEPGTFTQFSQRGSQRTDVRVIAEHPLPEQIDAHAVTWLDRQAFGKQADERMADHPNVQEAAQQRQAWLVENGYAIRAGESVELLPGAMDRLAGEERVRLAERIARRYGLPVNELPQGGEVDGEYRGTEHLHSGKLAIVLTEESVFVSPVNKDPDVATGSEVTLKRTQARDSSVELAAGQSLDLDAGLSLDGPGGD